MAYAGASEPPEGLLVQDPIIVCVQECGGQVGPGKQAGAFVERDRRVLRAKQPVEALAKLPSRRAIHRIAGQAEFSHPPQPAQRGAIKMASNSAGPDRAA